MKKNALFFMISIFLMPGINAMDQKQALEIAKPICHSCTPFEQKATAIAKSLSFHALLDPRDARVPRVFLNTNEHIASLSDWTPALWQEFGVFEKALELALRKTFNAQLVNVACLMNLAGPEGTHTHWHFIPRLAQPIAITDPVTQEKHMLEDPCYGKAYDMNGKNYRTATPNMQRVMIQAIQSHLDLSAVKGTFRQFEQKKEKEHNEALSANSSPALVNQK